MARGEAAKRADEEAFKARQVRFYFHFFQKKKIKTFETKKKKKPVMIRPIILPRKKKRLQHAIKSVRANNSRLKSKRRNARPIVWHVNKSVPPKPSDCARNVVWQAEVCVLLLVLCGCHGNASLCVCSKVVKIRRWQLPRRAASATKRRRSHKLPMH